MNMSRQFRRSALYVDRILKGAKPGDLPVGQPTTFERVVERKAAKMIGIKMPNLIMVHAERAID